MFETVQALSWVFDSVLVIIAFIVGVFLYKWISEKKVGDASERARHVVAAAERDAETLRKAANLEAKEMALKARGDFEDEVRRREREMQQIEQRILTKEEELARKLDDIDRRLTAYTGKDRALADREAALAQKESRLAQAVDEQRRKLEVIAGLTAEEAKRQLVGQMEEEARRDATLLQMKLEEQARETAHEKAKEVLATTIQRLAPDYTVETAVSVVDLPSDDMKGRIIGREGRNIRALELHTGVDLIVDDTPEAVLISAYDPYRREIARRSLQKLLADGRIHPARIEETYYQSKAELEEVVRQAGEQAVFEANSGPFHEELVKILGRLRFRPAVGAG